MYVILTDVLFKMTRFQKHEELKAEGGLVLFTSALGNAIFVSHEWAGEAHPDPTGATAGAAGSFEGPAVRFFQHSR